MLVTFDYKAYPYYANFSKYQSSTYLLKHLYFLKEHSLNLSLFNVFPMSILYHLGYYIFGFYPSIEAIPEERFECIFLVSTCRCWSFLDIKCPLVNLVCPIQSLQLLWALFHYSIRGLIYFSLLVIFFYSL